MSHSIIAVVLQCVVGLIAGDWLAGGIGACLYWLGREMAQAEYRFMGRFGILRSDWNWRFYFRHEAWNLDALVNDLLLPIACVLSVFSIYAVTK